MTQRNRPLLNTRDVGDLVLKRNFQNLVEYFATQSQLIDFQFLEYEFSGYQTGVKVRHSLGYTPKDVIVSHLSGSGLVTFNYDQFDSNFVVISSTGPALVRFFTGTQSNRPAMPGEDQTLGVDPTQNVRILTSAVYTMTGLEDAVLVPSLPLIIPQTRIALMEPTLSTKKVVTLTKKSNDLSPALLTAALGSTVEGSATYTISKYKDMVTLVANGSDWSILVERKT